MEQQTDSTPMYFKALCIPIYRSYVNNRNGCLPTLYASRQRKRKKNRSLAILIEFVIINSEA